MTRVSKLSVALILSGALASAGVAGESGAFVGVELGAGILTSTATGNGTNGGMTIDAQQGTANVGLDWGARLGYQLYFTPTHGARVYASYGMAHAYPLSATGKGDGIDVTMNGYITGQRIDLNIDYLVDFIKAENSSAGVYAGLFAGYSEYAITEKMQEGDVSSAAHRFYGGVGLGLNLGIQTTLAKHHRIEFGAKIPFLGPKGTVEEYAEPTPTFFDANFKYASVNASYSFVF